MKLVIFVKEGEWEMTTIQDIADKLNISKGTVSKALNNAPDISETLQKQILETAVELGYTKLRRYKNAQRNQDLFSFSVDRNFNPV